VLRDSGLVVLQDCLSAHAGLVVHAKAPSVDARHAAHDLDDLLRATDVDAVGEERTIKGEVSRLEERLTLERDALRRVECRKAPRGIVGPRPHPVLGVGVAGKVATAGPARLAVRSFERCAGVGRGPQREGAPAQGDPPL
jgi:hypothetical protein